VIRRGGWTKPLLQGAAHALACLAESRVREADDREAGEPRGDVDLHPDWAPVEALERGGEDACEHVPHGSGACSSARYLGLIRSAGL
jgi:hypothetical protein